MNHTMNQQSHCRGTAMSETIFVMPLLLIILSLLFYFGSLMVRAQRSAVMARYETWRQVDDAPGPESDTGMGHTELNDAFFGGNASRIDHWHDDGTFATDTLDELVTASQRLSGYAGEVSENILFRPPSDNPRLAHGHREGFEVEHPTRVPLWREFDGPVRRDYVRIGHDWRHTINWRAGPDLWQRGVNTSGTQTHYLRGVRDSFFDIFDDDLDQIDGDRSAEYSDYGNGPQQYNGNVLAGMIRGLYLRPSGYRGPIVDDERP